MTTQRYYRGADWRLYAEAERLREEEEVLERQKVYGDPFQRARETQQLTGYQQFWQQRQTELQERQVEGAVGLPAWAPPVEGAEDVPSWWGGGEGRGWHMTQTGEIQLERPKKEIAEKVGEVIFPGFQEQLRMGAQPRTGQDIIRQMGLYAMVGSSLLAGGLAKGGARPFLKLAPPKGAVVAVENPVVQKVTNLMRQARETIPQTKALRHEEMVKRFGAAAEALSAGEGEQAFIKALQALEGKYSVAEFIPKMQIAKGEIDELYRLILDSNLMTTEKIRAYQGLNKLLLPLKEGGKWEGIQSSELGLLEKIFGADFATMARAQGGKWDLVLDIANIPRGVLASWDLSGLLRQGGILYARHPYEMGKTVGPMVKAFAREKWALEMDDVIRSRPHFNLSQSFGEGKDLFHAPLVGGELVAREEMYMSRFLRYIPGVRRSERAFVTVLNDMRSRTWELTMANWERMGYGVTARDLEGLARLINVASGRGSMEIMGADLKALGPLLNATLFSPRLALSRIQFPLMMGYRGSPLVRKEATRMFVQFLGAGTSILSMMALAGAQMELDPRSADFGKIKIGKTRIDIWTGYLQYIRFATQLATAQRKTKAGDIQELNRADVMIRFGQTKASPAVGLLWDLLEGQSYMGEKFEFTGESLGAQAFNRLVPLFIQDLYDAMKEEGVAGLALAFPAFWGAGVITYRDEEVSTPSDLRDILRSGRGGQQKTAVPDARSILR